MPIARLDGINLYYEVRGEGPPILLIPGLGSDVRMYKAVTGELAKRFQVVIFDPRGAGKSDKPDVAYAIEEMADDAAGILDLLGLTKVTVVGYSMGGRIALSLALNHKEMVSRLVLASTSARTPPTRPLSWRWFVFEVLSRIPRTIGVDPQPRFAFERQRKASQEFECSSRLGEIKIPTLVVHGRNDNILQFRLAKEMASALPECRLVSVVGGHIALITTQRHRFVKEIEEFATV
jgi:3-oxoadipate enol-lactonase